MPKEKIRKKASFEAKTDKTYYERILMPATRTWNKTIYTYATIFQPFPQKDLLRHEIKWIFNKMLQKLTLSASYRNEAVQKERKREKIKPGHGF